MLTKRIMMVPRERERERERERVSSAECMGLTGLNVLLHSLSIIMDTTQTLSAANVTNPKR